MTGLVLSLCDRTGNMVQPWLEAGWRAITVDLKPAVDPHPRRTHVVSDVRHFELPDRPLIVFAFPPCTHLASSGARWFRSKGLAALIEALEIVEACRCLCEASGSPWMIENPVGRLSTLWREPDYHFHPCDFTGFELGDHYTKKSCLWTGNGFVMPSPRLAARFDDPDDRIHRAAPSPDRADTRSVTPMGFARAVFAANAPLLVDAAA